MKSNKILNKIAVIILSVLALVGIGFSTSRVVKNFSNTKDINAKTGDYTAVQWGEERVTGTNFVTFDAYFLKNGNKYRGEYLPYTKKGEVDYNVASKDLWVELRVLGNGSLRNAKLLFTQDNVDEKFALLESDTIANDTVGTNKGQVNLKEIRNGTTVLFRVNVNANLKKFKSDENKVKLVGEHVANDGTVTPIEKEVKFTVESSVDNAVVNNYYNINYYRDNNRYTELTLPTKDDQIVIEHPFMANFGTYRSRTYDDRTYFSKLTLNEGIIESNLEPLNGIYPSKVEINAYGFQDTDYVIEYDSNTGKMKIRFNNVSKIGSNDFDLKIKTYYPKSAMNYDNEHAFRIKTKAYAIVNNNPDFQNPIISDSVEAQSSVYYKHTPPVIPKPRTNRFFSSIYPPKKDLPINMYEGDNPDNTLEDWSVAWGFRIDNNGGNQDVTVSSTDGNDYLISSDSNNLDIGNFVNTKAIKFSYFDNNKLKDNSQIELYNKETGALIHTFNKEEIVKHAKEEYKIDSNVKKLKFVFKNIDLYYDSQYDVAFSITSLKSVDDKMIKDSKTREAFNKLYAIQSNYKISTNNIDTTVFGSAAYIESNRSLVTYYNTYFNDNDYYKTTDNRSVAKTGAIRVYKGNEQNDDLYTTTWVINSGNRRENNFQIISNNGEKFSENKNVVNKSYSKFHGMRFPVSPKAMLGDDGWIKVYNNDTNDLIAAFNSSNWNSYIDKPFIYENDVANIRVLTSKLITPAMFKIENVMNISDREIVDEINKNEFDKLNYINKHIDYSSKLTANSSEFTGNGNADISVSYYELNPIVYHNGSLLLSTYKTRSESFTLNLGTIAPYDSINPKSWKDSIILMEFPEDIVDLKDVRLTGDNVNVSGYEVIDKDGKKFLKAYLSSEELKGQQSITFSAKITVNPVADNKVTNTKVYVYNKENDKYLYESNNLYQRYINRDDVKDVYDINGDGNKNEKIGYTEIPTTISAPQELHINQKIINYNTDGDVVNAPNIGVIDGNGTGKATVVVQLKNNFPPSVTNVKILGAIPFKNNKGLLSGANLDSKNNTFMTGPIKIPDNLKSKVKVYYSENEDINRSWTLNDNQWKTEDQITDWSKIKNYYVDYGDKVFNVNELTEFSYEVNVPKNVTYNQPTFASNAVNVNLNTEDGILNTSAEANKVGVQLLKRFNLEIDVKKKATDKKLQGLVYSAKLDGEENSKTGITNNDGITTISGLLVDKEYTLDKISIEDNYISENSNLRFKVIENNGNMELQLIDGQNKVISSEIIQPTETVSTKVKMKFGYISKYNITLNKVDVATNEPLKSVQYELYEGAQLSRIYRTDKNGNAIFKKLIPGVEYTLKETYADGYYLNEPVKFKVVNTDGNPTISILSGNGENLVINKTNEDLDEASVKFSDIKAKRYSIDITKYVKGKDEKLSGSGFMVSGSDLLNDKVSETDSNGHTIISGLYEYKPGQSYNGEYTIEEIAPPEGYTRNSGKLKIKAQRNNAGVLEVSIIEDTLTRNINTGKDIVLEAADTDNAVYKIGVEDTPLFTIIKTDAKTGKKLPKTKFAIYEVDDDGAENIAYDSKGNIVGTEEEINGVRYRVVETDENGEYTKGLKPGQYKFVELSTVDKRYEISKEPIYVGVGEKLKPKYGWIKTEERYNGDDKETTRLEKNYATKELIKQNITYDENGRAQITNIWTHKIKDDNYVRKGDIVTLQEEENKYVVLDFETGTLIKELSGHYGDIKSDKIFYNRDTNKYIILDDEYNKLFEIEKDINDRANYYIYGGNNWNDFKDSFYTVKKVGTKYYIKLDSMLYELSSDGEVVNKYNDTWLVNDKLISIDYSNMGWESRNSTYTISNIEGKKIISYDNLEMPVYKSIFPYIDKSGNIKFYGGYLMHGDNWYYKFGIIVPESDPVSEIDVKNSWKKYAIKGKSAYGGNITDVGQYDYAGKKLEDVEIYSDSKKDIKITPNTGFKIVRVTINNEEIPLKLNSDGSMDLPKFKNVTEDKVIEAQFSNTISYVRVNHYKKDTNEKIADTEVLTGNYNANYATTPVIVEGYELERNVAGEFVKPTNATGTFTTDDIEVNYYYQPKQVDVITSYELENGTKIIPDSTQKVEYGKDYTTVPGVVDNKYELVSRPDNSNGKISSETPVTVRYIYKLKDAKVTVHHYIDGTTDKVPNNEGGVNEDQVINGRVDDAYNTAAITNIPANYKVVNTPANAAGTMTVDPIEVTYFYKLKDATIENSNFEKTSPQVINNINQKFVYNIKYTGSVKDYIGKGVLEIVDTLPYKIDIDKSDLSGGEYDEEHKTIKWKILVNNINSFDNNGNVEIIKTFGVVYKNLPIGEHVNITNTANVKFNLKDVPEVVGVTNKEKEVEATTDGQFTRKITVNKTWVDDNNANGKRPASIKYVLSGNNQTKEQVVTGNTNSDADWNYTFTNLTKYDAQGNEITYTVEEQEVNANDLKFYTKEVNGFNITNTFKLPEDKVNVTTTKTWVDSSNAKGKRPSSIKYILKGGATPIEKVVSGNNTTDENWSYTFENLAKYDSNGQEYQYNVEEEITENAHLYTKVITGSKENGFNVINTFKVPEDKLTIAVTKEWNDNSNVASKRPTSIKYVLKGGATPIEEVVSGNNTTDADWNHTFTNVAKYNDSGDEITYTLEEQEVSANDFKFYKKSISGDYKAGFNVANTFEVPDEKVEVQVNKVWEDDSNANTKRPASIKYILKGGAALVEQVVSGNANNNTDWSYKFTNLPKYSATGDEIQYTVEEQEVNTDELKFYEKEITGTMNGGFNIKNKFKVPEDKIAVNVVKTWEDNSNVNGKRPTSIKYVLSGNGSTKEQTVSGNTTTNENWSYTFANLPKYNAQGNEITYTVEEQEVNPGDLKFYNKQITGFNVTNTFRIPDDKVKVEITKKWEDSSNVSNKRPASVKIELSDGANVVRTQELTGTGNEWKHTFTDLPKYNSQGNTITYTLDEKEVNPGDLQFYTKSIVGNTITNTFTQSTDKINVNVSKTWNDSNNANRKRPVSIKYVLKNKETVVSEKVVAGNETTDADWTHTFTGLAKYDEHNDEIKYTLEEQEANEGELKFYTKQVNGDYKAGFNVVNTFKVPDERINVNISKTWNDNSNANNKRPASIKYVLSGNGSTVEQIVTGESNTDTNWSYEFSNLVKYEANTGNEISYTVREEEVNAGDLKFYEPTISGDYKAGINVTNKFVVPNDKVTPRVTITWEDNNNNGNKRPSNVKIIVKDKEGKVVKEGNVTGNPTDEEWNKVFENVPKYDKNGDPIPYTVEEKPNSPDDFKFYKITVTGDIDKGYKVTNKFEVPDEKITVKVKKVWEDSNNAASKRPTAIKVQLKNNAAIVREERVTGSGNEWTYTFENVSKYNGYGDVINYTVEEIEEQTEDLKFYEKKITGDKDSEYVITNKFKVPDEKIEINVNKTWEDNNNAANKRPTSIKYVLSGNNQTQEQVVSGNRTTDANWNYKFTNLPKYNAQGNEITYTVEEQEVNANDLKFYTKKVSGEQTNGFAVVNKFTVPNEKVTVKVSKTWDDNNNVANKRPASIKYEVLNSNNQIVASKVQSGNKNTADGWSHNFELDKYDALGNEEVYNVQEVEVNQNDFKFYKATVSGNYKSGFMVTNKFEVPNEEVTPKISVEWKDNSNQNNKRPTSVKIQVKDEEGRIVKESPVTGLITEESWKKIFENVPKYNKNGDPINYTITEEPNNPNDLEFYTTTTSGNITNGFKVVNTYAVPGTTISLKANKKWLDGNNAKNKRPQSIKIEVRNNNEVVADKEVKGNRTTDANWEVEFKNLPKYNPTTGAENVYTVTETEVHQGELRYYTSVVNGNTITNTIKPVTEGKIEDSKVEKESTLAKITKADEIVPYTITYKGKIKEYMGDAVVKIVDELPFKLDLSKSNIMDGSYDDESKTITWTENLNNIDTHSNGDKEVEIKKEIKLVYKDLKISEDNLKVTNKVRAEISLKELNKKITENNTKEIPAEISSKVTVKYVLKSNRSMKLKEDKVITGHVGDTYQTTIPNDIDQDAYEFVEVEGNENGKISQEEKVVTYLYKKKFGKVVVSYVEKSTGMKLQNDEVIKGNINEPYNAEGKEIEYYNLVSTEKSENAKPVITEDEQKITHYYEKKVFNIEIDKELKEATIDGEKRTFRNGKFTKLDIPVKKILNSEVKVRYSINVKNTGEIKGSTVVQENIPKYFTMTPSENPDWRIENGKIVSKEIELNPGESKELSITLKWTNSKDNFGTLVNKAGIEKTKNNAGFEETDTEEEKKGKKQQATLVLVPKTGLDINKLLQMTGVGITLTALVAAMGYTISRKVRE